MLDKQFLINEIAPALKAMNYKKRGNKWVKEMNGVYSVFHIQGSQYGKEMYYINLGISIAALGNKPAKISDCQIFERLDEKTVSKISDMEAVVKIVCLWEDKYGSVEKLKEKAFSHSLPAMTSRAARGYLLTV